MELDDSPRSVVDADLAVDLAVLLDRAPDTSVLVDAEGRGVAVDAVAADSVDEPDTLIGQRPRDRLHPDDVPHFRDALELVLRRGPGAWEVRPLRLIGARGSGWRVARLTNVSEPEGPPRARYESWVIRILAEDAARTARLSQVIDLARSTGQVRFAVLDARGCIREIHGSLGAPDVVGTHGAERLHPADVGTWRSALAVVLGSPGGSVRRRLRVWDRLASRYRWVDVTLDDRLDDPAIAGVVSTAILVDDEVRALERVGASEARLRALLRSSGESIGVLDAEAGILAVYSVDTQAPVAGQPEAMEPFLPVERIHPDDVDRVGELWADVLASPGETIRSEFRFTSVDGRVRWWEVALTNALSDPAVGGVIYNAHLIDARKASEDRTRRQLAQQQALVQIAQPSGEERSLVGVRRHAFAAIREALDAEWVGVLDGSGTDGATDELASATASTTSVSLADDAGSALVVDLGGRPPTDDELAFLDAAAATLASVGAELRLRAELERRAIHDQLTGLPNRTLLEDRLGHALARRGARLGVAFLDLDRFKAVNDGVGHRAGDELLRVVGQRMCQVVRPGDTVARFGGDEFVILLEDLDDPAAAVNVLERVRTAVAQPLEVGGARVVVTTSTGLVFGDDRSDAETLLRAADTALYRAKAEGRDRVVVFDAAMRVEAEERLEQVADLRRAFVDGGLELHHQPIVSLTDGRVVGFEALVRWRRDGEVVLPGAFLPLVADEGLDEALTRVVLDQALRRVASLVARGRPLFASVNVSASLVDERLEPLVDEALERHGVDPSLLVLELTEEATLADPEPAAELLQRLRDRGVRIALDDFGTGYSSLAHLGRLPLDLAKLDRSFVQSIDGGSGRVIATAVAAIADVLDIGLVAEGIETDEQADAAADLGFGWVQGFGIARPMTDDAFDRWLDERQRSAAVSEPPPG